MGPIPSGRLKNLKDIDKWSSLSLCLLTWDLRLYLSSQIGHLALSVLYYMEILSIKTIQ